MGRTLWLGMMFSAAAFAGKTMNIPVCNVGQIPAANVPHAQAEMAYVFRQMDNEIQLNGVQRGGQRRASRFHRAGADGRHLKCNIWKRATIQRNLQTRKAN